jgi:hypothetical protein
MTEADVGIDSRKARLDQLADQYLDAKAGIDKYGNILQQTGEQLVRELGIGGRHETVPGVGVRVQAPSMMFSAAKAREVLTPDQYAAICEPVPSLKLAAQLLPGALLDQCKVPGNKPSVRGL